MRGMLILWAVGSGLAACGATPSRTPAPSQLSEEACEPLHEALSDEHQRDVHDWSERARLAQDAASREVARAEAQALTRRYRDRFQVLADQGCGRARVQVLDLLGHIEPIDEDQVAGALEMLSLVASEDRDAWWISDIADNDVVRYFLRGPARVAAKEVLIDLAASTHDEEAQRGVLYELGYGLIQIRGTEQEREEGLLLLDRVAALWPGSREARQASALTRNTREMRIGAPMPTLAGSTADGEPLRLQDLSSQVVVVDFFGYWCKPCKEGLPVLKELAGRYPDDAFQVLGVNAFDEEEAFRGGCEQYGVSWPCIFDGPEAPLSQSLGVSSFPAVFVLDERRVIRARNPSEDELRKLVAELLQATR